MNTWVLIVAFITSDAATMTSVPGFVTAQSCEVAAAAWRSVDTSRHRTVAMCAKQ